MTDRAVLFSAGLGALLTTVRAARLSTVQGDHVMRAPAVPVIPVLGAPEFSVQAYVAKSAWHPQAVKMVMQRLAA